MNLHEILNNVYNYPKPLLGIDLDGTIDEAPVFFNILTNIWPEKVYIITYRNDYEGIKEKLAFFNIKYTDIIMVNSFEQKAEEIVRLGISVFFDDMDEVLQHIHPNVNVMKVRNGGNFDYEDKKWLYSKRTGKNLDFC